MSLDKRFFQLAQERMSMRRAENKLTEEKRREEVNAKIPQFVELEKRLAGTMDEIVKILAAKDGNAESEIKSAIESNSRIQLEMNRLLIENGYPADYIAPIYTCKKCLDKGVFEGKWCDCFRRILNGIAAEDLNSRSPLRLCSFDTFNINLYPDEIDKDFGTGKREVMKQNFDICVKYAEEFDGHGYGLFMIGNTGLGKTHLSLAIANAVIGRGFCVIYGSTPELLRKLQKEQFSKSEKSGDDTMLLLTDCDLLILDDLGAENSSEYTAATLYEIINARQSRSLPIIINTNLDEDELKNRYKDRLWSRLFSMKVLFFCGNDNRLNTSLRHN